MNKGKFDRFVMRLTNNINALFGMIESHQGEIVRLKVSQNFARGSSEERRETIVAFKESLARSSSEGAPEQREREHELSRPSTGELAAREGVRAAQSRQRQQQLDKAYADLEEVMARAMEVKKAASHEETRHEFTQARSRALLIMLQRAVKQRNGEKLRKVITDAKAVLSQRANSSANEASTDDFSELRSQTAAAGEVLNEWDDEKDRQSARVNVTLHSLDSNNHLVTRTLTEEPMGKMFPTSMSIELLNLVKDQKGKQQRDRDKRSKRQGPPYSIRPSSAGVAEHEDDFVGLSGLDVPSAPPVSEDSTEKRDTWEERHRQRITDQMVNRISTATSEGHVARDMGIAVISKRYEFGLTYELPPEHESNPNESDLHGGLFCNTKFRVILVSRETLGVAREIEPASIVPPGSSQTYKQFLEQRWSSIRALADLIDKADELPVKKRRLLYSGSSKSVELALVVPAALSGGPSGGLSGSALTATNNSGGTVNVGRAAIGTTNAAGLHASPRIDLHARVRHRSPRSRSTSTEVRWPSSAPPGASHWPDPTPATPGASLGKRKTRSSTRARGGAQ